jgi:hypothetical protein
MRLLICAFPDFCPSKACSNDTLKNASMTIASACQSNTGKGAMDGLDLGKIIPAVLYNFDDIKAAACIEHKSNMSYCIPELLTNIERASGLEFNVSTIESLASGGVTDILARLSSIPSSSYCTDCGSAFVTEGKWINQNRVVSAAESSSVSSDGSGAVQRIHERDKHDPRLRTEGMPKL